MVADPRPALTALAGALEARLTPGQRGAGAQRLERRRRERGLRSEPGPGASTLEHFLSELARRTGGDLIVFDEALTSSPAVVKHLPPDRPGDYFLTRGGSLGVGIPGALGAKLAHPDRTVVGFTGDGGAMYTYQALWTAGRYGIGAKFVVCNNRKYRLLDDNIAQYWKERGIPGHDFPSSFDLSRPDIRFADLARALGADGIRVEKPEEAADAVARMLAAPGPFLVDLQV